MGRRDDDQEVDEILHLRARGEETGRTVAAVGMPELRLRGGGRDRHLSGDDVQIVRERDRPEAGRVLPPLSDPDERDPSRAEDRVRGVDGRLLDQLRTRIRDRRKQLSRLQLRLRQGD